MKLLNIKDSQLDIEKTFDLLYKQWGHCFKKTKEEKIAQLQRAINKNSKFPQMYILKEKGVLVGTFSFERTELDTGNVALLRYVVINPEFRGKGYGHILLNYIDKIGRNNYDKVFLITNLNGFYEKIGFTFLRQIDQNEEINKLYSKNYINIL